MPTAPTLTATAEPTIPVGFGQIDVWVIAAAPPGEAPTRLPGCLLSIENTQQHVMARFVTGSDGTARSPLLPLGSYTVIMDAPPPGYLLAHVAGIRFDIVQPRLQRLVFTVAPDRNHPTATLVPSTATLSPTLVPTSTATPRQSRPTSTIAIASRPTTDQPTATPRPPTSTPRVSRPTSTPAGDRPAPATATATPTDAATASTTAPTSTPRVGRPTSTPHSPPVSGTPTTSATVTASPERPTSTPRAARPTSTPIRTQATLTATLVPTVPPRATSPITSGHHIPRPGNTSTQHPIATATAGVATPPTATPVRPQRPSANSTATPPNRATATPRTGNPVRPPRGGQVTAAPTRQTSFPDAKVIVAVKICNDVYSTGYARFGAPDDIGSASLEDPNERNCRAARAGEVSLTLTSAYPTELPKITLTATTSADGTATFTIDSPRIPRIATLHLNGPVVAQDLQMTLPAGRVLQIPLAIYPLPRTGFRAGAGDATTAGLTPLMGNAGMFGWLALIGVMGSLTVGWRARRRRGTPVRPMRQ